MKKKMVLFLSLLSLYIGFRGFNFKNNLDSKIHLIKTSYLRNRGLLLISLSQKLKGISVEERETILIDLYKEVHPNDWRARQVILMLLIFYSKSDLNFWNEIIQSKWTPLDELYRIYKFGVINPKVKINIRSHRSVLGKNYAGWFFESYVAFLVDRGITPEVLFDGLIKETALERDFKLICNFYKIKMGGGCVDKAR